MHSPIGGASLMIASRCKYTPNLRDNHRRIVLVHIKKDKGR